MKFIVNMKEHWINLTVNDKYKATFSGSCESCEISIIKKKNVFCKWMKNKMVKKVN